MRLAAIKAALVAIAFAAAPALAGDISPAEGGARYGQAQSAAKFCPGGKVTAKAESIAKSFTGDGAAAFEAERVKVVEGWDKAFQCIEIDPNSGKTTECRKMRLTSCRQAWIEIGAEGRNLPGMLDVDFSAWEAEHAPKD